MNNKSVLTDKQIEFVRRAVTEPVLFAQRILGVKLWDKQIEILNSVRNHRRTAIKSCHAGKTFILGVLALWWLARYRNGLVITTSSTFRQVKSQIWAEIHRLVANAKVPYPEVNKTELKLRGENNVAFGLSTNKAENFQGCHGRHILIIVDEAPGIDPEIWPAIAGITAGGDVRVAMAGNPTTPSGPFYDAFYQERSSWNCITIDSFDTPNLKGITLEQLLASDPSEGGSLDQNRFPYLVSGRWVYEQYFTWWHGDEQSSPIWMSRVRVQFPDQAEDSLIKLRWLERARDRARENPVADTGRRLVVGVDVGGGHAETVVFVCEILGVTRRIIDMGAWRAEDTRGQVVRFLAPFCDRLTNIYIDGTGIAHNFGLHLRDQGFPVELAKVGMPCSSRPELVENDPAKRFANEKARLYQVLADALERDQIEGLSDETTIAQLADLRFDLDSRGRMRIESKRKIIRRRGASPDRAEALMLAIGNRRVPNWLDSYTATDSYRQGRSREVIADELEASIEQVDRWIREGIEREAAAARSPYETDCPFCHQIMAMNDDRASYGGKVYHKLCVAKMQFGPHTATKPVPLRG